MQVRSDGNVQEAKKHLQIAIRVCRWLAKNNSNQPWSNWVKTELVQHYSTLNRELHHMLRKRQAVVFTNRQAGELAAEAEQHQQQEQASSQEQQEQSCSTSNSSEGSNREAAGPSQKPATANAGPSSQKHLLPKAKDLLLWQQGLVDQALQAAAAANMQSVQVVAWDQGTARLVRDAAMCCTLFGYNCLAQRSEVLCAAKASQHALTACSSSEPPCPDPACHGVRFECNNGSWQLVVPHHKGTSRGMAGPVLRIQDTQFKQLLTLYERHARPNLLWGADSVLAGIDGDDAESGLPLTMFVTDTGQAYTDQSLGEWWKGLHK